MVDGERFAVVAAGCMSIPVSLWARSLIMRGMMKHAKLHKGLVGRITTVVGYRRDAKISGISLPVQNRRQGSPWYVTSTSIVEFCGTRKGRSL